MATDPLDLEDLLREAEMEPVAPDRLAQGTRIGHIHLQVSDVQKAVQFYHGILGFDVVGQLAGSCVPQRRGLSSPPGAE